ELCSENGDIHWRGYQEIWGKHEQWQQSPDTQRYYQEEAANDPVTCDLRYQGQIYDKETGLYYNRFRYYDPEIAQYLTLDPIGMAGGLRPQGYVYNPVSRIDPLGLVHETASGYGVYALYDVDAVTNRPVGDPYYIGITNDFDRRAKEHIETGRLTGDRKTRMFHLSEDITYGEARGYEQAYIDHYGTKTGSIGDEISQKNRGNKVASFDRNNKTRRESRQQYFEDAYIEKTNQLKPKKSGCA
uniref:RHS repeat-associated core domain-containing protein n=1 Tax=Oceanospirillum beijerinckii TaxID=64976 RepID=UPI000684E34E